MPKCLRSLFLSFALLCGMALPVSVQAQAPGRAIPAEAKLVELEAANGQLSIDGKRQILTPGLQVRDPNNLLVFVQSLQGRYKAHVLFDFAGLHRVWILERLN